MEANRQIVDTLLARGVVQQGDFVIITRGDLSGHRGGTNNMKIVQAGQPLADTF
jgi:pyruvate kinase